MVTPGSPATVAATLVASCRSSAAPVEHRAGRHRVAQAPLAARRAHRDEGSASAVARSRTSAGTPASSRSDSGA
jgi:hypothetical protein